MTDVRPLSPSFDISRMSGAVALRLFDASPDVIVVTDQFGCLRWANPAAYAVLGYDVDAMHARSLFELLHPDEREDALNSFATTAAVSGSAEPIVLRIRASDGAYRCFELVATNLVHDPVVAGMVLRCRDISERLESQQRFRTMFEQSAVAQALVAPSATGVIANRAFAALFRTTREALLTTTPESLVHVDDRAAMAHDFAKLAHGDVSRVVAERRYVRGNGDLFEGRVAASVLRTLRGDVEFVFVTVDDVSEQAATHRALVRSEERFRALVENSPDIVAILYEDGEWEASDQGTRLLGYPKGFDPPGGVFSLIHPDDMEGASVALDAVRAGTRAANDPLELRLRDVDGVYREFECVGQDLSHDHQIRGVVITARDVTARKRTEARLRSAQQRFQVTFDEAPIVVSIVDLDGRIIDINRAGCTLLGRSRDDLIGSPAEEVVHPDDRDFAIDQTTAQIAGATHPAEFRIVDHTGTAVPVLSNATLVAPSDENEDPYVITLQTDISDRKQLEAELEQRATHDGLTGLANRTLLEQHLTHALAQRNPAPLAVLFIDLDDFKYINDSLGHAAGDEALIHVARALRQTLRSGDVIARIGGDEFVAMCQLASTDEALVVAERLQQAIESGFEYCGRGLRVGASIGVTPNRPGDTTESVIRRADTATYIAKRAGKGRIELIGDDTANETG